MTKLAETSSGPFFSRLSISGSAKADVFAPLGVVGGVEAAADVAFVGVLARILPVRVVEVREVRQVGHIGHQALDACLERLPHVRSALRQALVDLAG